MKYLRTIAKATAIRKSLPSIAGLLSLL
jgi:hypothetical protein